MRICIQVTKPKAKKRRCSLCGEVIEEGERYLMKDYGFRILCQFHGEEFLNKVIGEHGELS